MMIVFMVKKSWHTTAEWMKSFKICEKDSENIKDQLRKEDRAIYDNVGKDFEPTYFNTANQAECNKATEHLVFSILWSPKVTEVHGDLIEATVERNCIVDPFCVLC